ncbi:MAG TPA: CrcB family protein [Ilumatobacteraceae bacterium]|nr:CrcB family protein [Ilumatobacteraceae bacterium]
MIDHPAPFAVPLLAAIAVGGALGATGRWGVGWVLDDLGSATEPGVWPWATLIVNVVGCLLIGLAARLLVPDTVAWAFVVTGILGGFTTFSAVAVELNDFAAASRLPMAIAYGTVSIAAGVAATFVARRPVEVGE